jgi:hypothetical protein
LVVSDMITGLIALYNEEVPLCVSIEWPVKALPYCWIWHENLATGGIWNYAGQMLGIEPSTVNHHCGIAEAIRSGGAIALASGQEFGYRISLRILQNARMCSTLSSSRSAPIPSRETQ